MVFCERILWNKFILINVEIKVITKTIKRMRIFCSLTKDIISKLKKERTNEPKLAIRYKKKEKSNKLLKRIFLETPEKKVVPLRLIPGKIASPWNKPMIILST